jgi:hypothetical protein
MRKHGITVVLPAGLVEYECITDPDVPNRVLYGMVNGTWDGISDDIDIWRHVAAHLLKERAS